MPVGAGSEPNPEKGGRRLKSLITLAMVLMLTVATLLHAGARGEAGEAPNLLRNPGFDGEPGFVIPSDSQALPGGVAWVYKSIGEIQAPIWWTPFWSERPVDNETFRNYRRPEYKVTSQKPPWTDPKRIDKGEHSYQFFGFCGAIDAGLYQQVAVEKGRRYRFTARGHIWSTCDDDFRKSGNCEEWDATQGALLVGLDVTGATDPFSGDVIWGERTYHYDEFGDIAPVEAVAESKTITVFIRSIYRWAYVHNDTFVDTAKLVAVEGAARSGQ